MAGLGRKTFTAGEVLTAANVQGYLMDQAVMVFAGTAARTSAVATATTGMVSVLTGASTLIDYYNGTGWKGLNYTTVTSNTATAYTAVATDANTTMLASNASAQTIVIPDLFQIGERIDIVREGAGTVSISAGTGITTWAGVGTAGTAKAFAMGTQYAAATILKVAANSYRVIGAVA